MPASTKGNHRMTAPYIVGIGGTTRANSSTEKALQVALAAAREQGARTTAFLGEELATLPMYAPEDPERTELAKRFVDELRAADGIIIAAPAYHGTLSGLVKNALDYTQDMMADARVYFDGRSVGCIASGAGWQGVVATLTTLRQIVHSLRGWPTPLGAGINSLEKPFDAEGNPANDKVKFQLETVGREVVQFANAMAALRSTDA